METRIALRYSGPAVDSGLMDVYEASANMIAFSEFVVAAAKSAYGDAVHARAEVAGFGHGSFVTDLVFHVAGASATVFAAVDPKTLWTLVEEALSLWKHLKGTPPSGVEYNGNTAHVTNNNGEISQFSIQSLTLVFSDKGSQSAQQFIQKALDKPGMDAVEVASERRIIDRVTNAEANYFVPVAPTDTITDVTVRMALIVEGPVFKDDNKWRFSDGQHSFFAHIEDNEFQARVDAGERFGRADIIIADVRICQQQSGTKITADRAAVKIHEHRAAPRQLPLR